MGTSPPVRRIAFTLPTSTAADLSYVSLRLGISKSDLVGGLLSVPLSMMRDTLFSFPDPIDRLSPEDKTALMSQFFGLLDGAVSEVTTFATDLQNQGDGPHG